MEKVTKNNLTIISKPHSHFHTMKKIHAKFQNGRHTTVRGAPLTRHPGQKMLTERQTDGRTSGRTGGRMNGNLHAVVALLRQVRQKGTAKHKNKAPHDGHWLITIDHRALRAQVS